MKYIINYISILKQLNIKIIILNHFYLKEFYKSKVIQIFNCKKHKLSL